MQNIMQKYNRGNLVFEELVCSDFEEYSDIFTILLFLCTAFSIFLIFFLAQFIYITTRRCALFEIDTFKMEIQNVKNLFSKKKIAFKIYFSKTILYFHLNSFQITPLDFLS